jgi:arsenate reductase-like glutaredoxin family protein
MQKLVDEPLLLVQPLTRSGKRLSVGLTEPEWRAWVAAERLA